MSTITGAALRWASLRRVITEERHRHEPLSSTDHTRMLLLHGQDPAHPNELHAELFEITFEMLRKTPYVALSYTWGDGASSDPIFLHPSFALKRLVETATGARTDLPARPRKVGQNLYHALMIMRPKNKMDRAMVWIDALCINQDDTKEKAKQLAKINLVYERASSVMIWLGPEDEEGRAGRAIKFVRELTDFANVKKLANDPDRVEDWQSLVELMTRPWFSRRWILQELALGGQAIVLCGSDRVPWADVRDAISMMARYFNDICSLFMRDQGKGNDYFFLGDIEVLRAMVLVKTIHNIFRRDAHGATLDPMQGLEYLVTTLSKFEAGDPRDTITTVRNIAKEAIGSGALSGAKAPPLPNSDPNKTLLEIYIDFLQWIYDTSGRIDIICHKWALPEKSERPRASLTTKNLYPTLSVLPSWIQTVPPRQDPWTDPNTSQSQMTSSKRLPKFERRIEGDVLAGTPDNRPYNCSLSIQAHVVFPFIPDRDYVEQDSPDQSDPDTPADNSTADDAADKKRKREADDEAGDPDSKRQATRDAREERIRAMQAQGVDLPPGINLTMVDGSEIDMHLPTVPTPRPQETPPLSIDTTISIDGIQIGTIIERYDQTSEGIIRREVLGALRRSRRDKADDAPDRLWRALIAERAADGSNPPPEYWRACTSVMRSHLTNGNLDTRDLLKKDHHLGDVEREYLKRVHTVTFNRSFFEARSTLKSQDDARTEANENTSTERARSPAGRVISAQTRSRSSSNSKGKAAVKDVANDLLQGFGPGECRSRDIVCVLFGCSVPVILRPVDQTLEKFTLVGECYVYGMMDGEAVTRYPGSVDQMRRAFRIK